MEKIKVIDLLNKIAKDEEVPDKIKYRSHIFSWSNNTTYPSRYTYVEEQIIDNGFHYNYFVNFIGSENNLNDEVEIIEEDKKIEKLWLVDFEKNYEYRINCEQSFQDVVLKIDELIDEVNKLKGEE